MTSPAPTNATGNFSKMMKAWVSGEYTDFTEESMLEFKDWWERIQTDTQPSPTHSDPHGEEWADEVIGLLVELKKTGNDSIESLAGFKTALLRHLRRHKPTAKSELWGITNEALKQLEKDKRIRLVFRSDQKNNRANNRDKWAGNHPEAANTPCKDYLPDDFELLKDIWFEKVAQPRKDATHQSAKLVSPTEAQNFLSAVLERFKRVMTMEQLHEALVRNNRIFSTETVHANETDDGESSGRDPISNAPATGLSKRTFEFVRRESERRGKGLGAELLKEKLCPLFNGYYIRKKLHEERVVLAGFGGQTAQRNSESVVKIEHMLRCHLPFFESPDEFVPDEIAYDDMAHTRSHFFDKMDTIRIELLTHTLEVAESYCSENCRA
jgi:hypothetical protein